MTPPLQPSRPVVPGREVLKAERALVHGLERRLFLRQSLSVGALALLTGCDITDNAPVQAVLTAMSRWNDRVQAWLFDPNRLAPTYPESAVVRDFRYNAYYPQEQAPVIDAAGYRLELTGLIGDRTPWTYDRLLALPQVAHITRHVCVEGWSMIGKWGGCPLRTFLERVDADLTARYVGFTCADGYSTSIDMPSALHPQTLLAFTFADEVLPTRFGFPFKIRIPTKLGFKNPKWVVSMTVTNTYPGGYWENTGYNWFAGL